ncbi:hypothetical protein DNX69_10925 [Rhodopseudomonas palustris]|uniref:Phage tail assembly protein n=1 Tax=Rhodopseudomonas palustris TaxID=1076 RepID=A0A323UJ85_RHOPL|nr:phage tail assembly protein [Rhodopseudomonas palustris]PZA12479.1 hypothetical protein DNX69_10925 [Rhodopseudomonas palustris]
MVDDLPPPIDAEPALKPVLPPPGSPDYARNSGVTEAPAETAAKMQSEPPPLVAVLQFQSGDLRSKRFQLDWPFELDGVTIDAITVRRLPMVTVNNLVASERYRDLYEIYAEMTGLSAAVLRGLDSDDGELITGACWDFLPRLLRTVHE